MFYPSARRPRQPRHGLEADLVGRWIDEHAPELYRFAYRLCDDGHAAEDLVQETFHEAWKHPGPLREIQEPRPWLFLILRRRYAKMRRLEQMRPWVLSLAAAPDAMSETAPSLAQTEHADVLQAALDGMSDLFKMPLLMVFVQGLTCAQAAEALDLPLGTVLSRIHRAKQHLREAMRRRESSGTGAHGAGLHASATEGRARLRIGGAR